MIAGEVIPNDETICMAQMIRENATLVGELRLLLWTLSRAELALVLKARIRVVLMPHMKNVCPFTRAAILTAIRTTVDWERVISLVLTDPEAN